MKDLLMIAYYYPPLGGIGSQRPLYFSRYLPRNDWNANILTIANDYNYPRDKTLLKLIPDKQRIYRAYRMPIFKTFSYLARKNLRQYPLLYSFLDPYFDWVPSATRIGLKALKTTNYSAIYATAPPYSSLRVAVKLKAQMKLPIVADLRDPFTDNKFITWPSTLHKNEYMKRQVMARTGYSEDDVIVIPNGYDDDKLSKIQASPPKDRFVLGYVGSIYGELNPRSIFRAVKFAVRERPEMIEKMKIEFMGQMNEKHIEYEAKREGIESLVRFHGNRPHEDALSLMKSCHVLLLIGGMAIQEAVPAKLFEYASTGQPVLSFSKPGMLEDFIIREKFGFSVDGDEPHKGGRLIVTMFDEFVRTGVVKGNKYSHPTKFTRENLTPKLARVLDTLI
ncbi:MAG: glycosyltransferase [Candidatus Thorarchaeota archaeon]|jgi:glycosyltransferase involved in cell wall biosynthesis